METIIQKFQQIYTTIKNEKGIFYLFMVMKMDEFTDRWSVVVSAPWITTDEQSESFEYIAHKMSDTLSPEEIVKIARIGTFLPDEHLIKIINESIRVQGEEPIKLENTKLNGYFINEAFIFESNPPSS